MSQRFVLDASIVVAACLGEREAADAVRSVIERLATTPAVVPAIWPCEVANALLVKERRGILTAEAVAGLLGQLEQLPIEVDSFGLERVFAEATKLARAHGLSVYDATYLDLALRLAVPLATLDTSLQAAANATGIEVIPG